MAELRFVFRFSAKAKCRLGPGRDDRGALVFVLLLALRPEGLDTKDFCNNEMRVNFESNRVPNCAVAVAHTE